MFLQWPSLVSRHPRPPRLPSPSHPPPYPSLPHSFPLAIPSKTFPWSFGLGLKVGFPCSKRRDVYYESKKSRKNPPVESSCLVTHTRKPCARGVLLALNPAGQLTRFKYWPDYHPNWHHCERFQPPRLQLFAKGIWEIISSKDKTLREVCQPLHVRPLRPFISNPSQPIAWTPAIRIVHCKSVLNILDATYVCVCVCIHVCCIERMWTSLNHDGIINI